MTNNEYEPLKHPIQQPAIEIREDNYCAWKHTQAQIVDLVRGLDRQTLPVELQAWLNAEVVARLKLERSMRGDHGCELP